MRYCDVDGASLRAVGSLYPFIFYYFYSPGGFFLTVERIVKGNVENVVSKRLYNKYYLRGCGRNLHEKSQWLGRLTVSSPDRKLALACLIIPLRNAPILRYESLGVRA